MNLSQAEIDAMMKGTPPEAPAAPANGMSQAEIDAMLNGSAPAAPAESSGGMSQAEIDAMMGGGASEPPAMPNVSELLTPVEIDTLGEVGNICMGAVATTMYTLLDRRVEITTPEVSVGTVGQVFSEFERPFVVVDVEYVEGISGKNILILTEYDAALITDVLMGGDGTVEEPIELSELHMSAINEIMNQMIAASATALSQLIYIPVNISTPQSVRMSNEDDFNVGSMDPSETIIRVNFSMEIEGLLSSRLIQLMAYDQGKQLSALLGDLHTTKPQKAQSAQPSPEPAPAPAPPPPPPAAAAPPPAAPMAAAQVQQAPPPATPQMASGFDRTPQPVPGELVDVRPMQFESFDKDKGEKAAPSSGGIGVVSNIPLVVSAELGTTSKNLSEVLEFKPGMVITLNKAAGDPVDIMVNGKFVARGEVVVIDDNYGIRITDLPSK